MTPMHERLAEFLLDIEAVRLSVADPFTLASGIKSPIYCDCRMMYSHPEARDFVVSALVQRVNNLHIPPDVIAGTATAAIGWAALVAERLSLPFVYARSKPKDHGTRKLVEGDLTPEQHVVLMEDVIVMGTSSMISLQGLREEGKAIVSDIVSIFSYDFAQAHEQALEASVHLHPLTTIATLLQVAADQNRISATDAKEVLRFVKDPQHWYV